MRRGRLLDKFREGQQSFRVLESYTVRNGFAHKLGQRQHGFWIFSPCRLKYSVLTVKSPGVRVFS
jgi:hypothetical protein